MTKQNLRGARENLPDHFNKTGDGPPALLCSRAHYWVEVQSETRVSARILESVAAEKN
jgi:hypothetical protein